jgi:dienelactone hydrolase
MEKALVKSKAPYQISLYSGVPHGFAVRHEDGKPYNEFVKEQAFLQAIQWFNFHIKARH